MRSASLVGLVAIGAAPLSGQQQIEFGGRAWTAQGEPVRVERFMGREALRARNALVVLPEATFENGTLEFEVATTGHRSFVGVAFHIAEGGAAYEEFYLRPHQSGRFDAMQYTPVNHRVSAWQLYPEYNATTVIEPDRWIHVRLEIAGSRLEVFLDRSSEPVLVVPRLRAGSARGAIALRSTFPAAGQVPDLYPTAFANVVMTPSTAPAAIEAPADPAPGFVTEWEVSPARAVGDVPLRELPADWEAGPWTAARVDAEGRVNLARYAGIPAGASRGTVFVRTTIESGRDQVRKLDFGFSDAGSVFLNGQVLFTGDNTYLTRSGRYLGVMTIDNDALYLPLRAGANELVFAVTETFGGWGVTARLERREESEK